MKKVICESMYLFNRILQIKKQLGTIVRATIFFLKKNVLTRT